MSETPSRPTGTEPTEGWYRDITAGMPVTPVPGQTPVPGAPVGVDAAAPGEGPTAAPALRQAHWSGKKTAVAAALAIGLSTVGVVGAAAVIREGSGTALDGPGAGSRRGQFPGGQPPNGQLGQSPGQLGQSNHQLPDQLTRPLSPLGDDLDDSASDDDSSDRATDT
jgi:hypothetical protein